MKNLVIIPTYNEVENIQALLPEILAQCDNVDILVVDDSSPDGTGEEVLKLKQKFPNVNLLSRDKKEGLGKAYIAGFKWGLSQGYDVLIEMDADFSHRPVDLKSMVAAIESEDFCIGSRYVEGGGTKNWGLIRKLISRGGSIYSRLILGYPINDWTGGFNAWKSEVLIAMGLDNIRSNGYCFQIELKYRASKLGYKSREVPILFEDRRVGESKMSLKIVLEAFYKVWLLRFN